MAFDNTDFDFESEPEEEPAPAAEGASNRPFLLAAGLLGGLFLLTLLCLVGFLVARPLISGGNGVGSAQETAAAQINFQNTVMAGTATQARMVALWTSTPSPTLEPSATRPRPSATPVLAQPATATPLDLVNSRTATVSALLTLAATSQNTGGTATLVGGGAGGNGQPTSTALPDSGLADNVGVPGMVALAVILVGVIFLTRRLRS